MDSISVNQCIALRSSVIVVQKLDAVCVLLKARTRITPQVAFFSLWTWDKHAGEGGRDDARRAAGSAGAECHPAGGVVTAPTRGPRSAPAAPGCATARA